MLGDSYSKLPVQNRALARFCTEANDGYFLVMPEKTVIISLLFDKNTCFNQNQRLSSISFFAGWNGQIKRKFL